MTDDSSKRGPQDRNRVNINQKHELDYWTKELGVTQGQLEKLVQHHGNSAKKIREVLQQQEKTA